MLALWRSHGGDTTLTLFNAQNAPLDSLKVSLPARIAAGRFVLGAGAPRFDAPDSLNAGPFMPYETKVVRIQP